MSDDFTEDDVRQMLRDGDLVAFMRTRLRPTKQTKDEREFPAAAPPKSRADGRPVGSWPLGTYPPGSPIPGRPADAETPEPE